MERSALAKSITCPESETDDKTFREPAGTDDSCSKDMPEHHQGRDLASGGVYEFQLVNDCNGSANEIQMRGFLFPILNHTRLRAERTCLIF